MRKRSGRSRQARSEIGARLRLALAADSLAQIAGKTGVSTANVHRYLHGARVPADFCASLIAEYSVNPVWLLTGEGTPGLADVSSGAERMGSDLLALVAAMNETTRMRLGALAGKRHLKVLRELNEALGDFERLRDRLADSARPVLAGLIEEYRVAVRRKDMARSEDLRRAATQASRLAPDPELAFQIAEIEARHAAFLGDRRRALALQRQVYLHAALGKEQFSRDGLLATVNLVMALIEHGELRDAIAVSGAALALAPNTRYLAPARAPLVLVREYACVMRGSIRGRIERMLRAASRMTPRDRIPMSGALVTALLLSGTVEIAAVARMGSHGTSRVWQLLAFALCTEDEAALGLACDEATSSQAPVLPSDPPTVEFAKLALAAIADRRRAPLLAFRKSALLQRREAEPLEVRRFAFAVQCAQAARLGGDAALAIADFRTAQDLLGKIAPGVTPGLLSVATHHRNALLLAAQEGKSALLRDAAQRAQKFFRRHVARGYGCFAAMLPAEPSVAVPSSR